jgi:acetamidase/formamidase
MRIGADQVHYVWDNTIPPIVDVASGGRIELDLSDASGGQLTADSASDAVPRIELARVNPVTGPIRILGATPGDAVVVRILELDVASWGWSALIPGFGLLAEDFPDPLLVHHRTDAGRVELGFGPRLPALPMIGTLGVAPAETGQYSLLPPTRYGGNLDVRHVTAGAAVRLPVGVPGALLSAGDAHATMGDGEVCGTGVETAARALVQIDVLPGAAPRYPIIETAANTHREGPALMTTAVDPDLMSAAKDATRAMIDEVTRMTSLSAEHAYILCSLAADLVISEIVDAPNWVVGLHLPTSALA